MTPDQKRARVVALFDEVVNAHDETAIARFTRSPQIEATLHQLLAGFPALHFDVIWTIAEADRVVAFIDMPGTHEGPWLRVQEPTHWPMRTGLLHDLVTSDLWCREVLLEGCSPCPSRIRRSSATM